MNRTIIAFAGSKGAGKTTAFNTLTEKFNNVSEVMLAGLLKTSCSTVFGFDESKLSDLQYKEELLDTPIELTKENIEAVIKDFGVEFDYDAHVRPHVGMVLDTRRQVLQYIGTDVLHTIDKLIHIKAAVNNMPKEGIVVVTDLRFEQEFDYFKDNHSDEFFPFYLKNNRAELEAEGDTHPSETQLKRFKNKCIPIDNNSSLEDYRGRIVENVRSVL